MKRCRVCRKRLPEYFAGHTCDDCLNDLAMQGELEEGNEMNESKDQKAAPAAAKKEIKRGKCPNPFCKNYGKEVRIYWLGLCTCYFNKKKREKYLKWRDGSLEEEKKKKEAAPVEGQKKKNTDEHGPARTKKKAKKRPAAGRTPAPEVLALAQKVEKQGERKPAEASTREAAGQRQKPRILQELAAMDAVARILMDLDGEMQRNVLEWAAQKFVIESNVESSKSKAEGKA